MILDSDILIGILREDRDAASKYSELVKEDATLFTTAINTYELFEGAFQSPNPVKKLQDILRVIITMEVLPFDLQASKLCGKVSNDLRIKGKTTGAMDIMVAAIALANDKKIITRNKKHFENIP